MTPDEEFNAETRRVQLKEHLDEAWRLVMEAVSSLSILPLEGEPTAPHDPVKIVDQVETALHAIIGAYGRLKSRTLYQNSCAPSPCAELETRNRELENDLVALREALAATQDRERALKERLEVALVNEKTAERDLLNAEAELARERSRARSITAYKDHLKALPANDELRNFAQSIVDIMAPDSASPEVALRQGVTLAETAAKVREMKYDFKSLKEQARHALGIDDYKPIVDNIRSLRASAGQLLTAADYWEKLTKSLVVTCEGIIGEDIEIPGDDMNSAMVMVGFIGHRLGEMKKRGQTTSRLEEMEAKFAAIRLRLKACDEAAQSIAKILDDSGPAEASSAPDPIPEK